jgi:hypothetical protein
VCRPYGQTRKDAIRKAQALSLRVLAERLELGEALPQVQNVSSIVAQQWPSTRAARVLAALLRNGWSIKRQSG